MLKVVSNTTPIISLLKIDQLELLHQLYESVYIPTAVLSEIEVGKAKGFYKDLTKIDWIRICEVKDKQAVKYFLDLDAGESEAIVLATELQADLLLIDERLGRFHAKHADLTISGTLGVLVKAKNQGLLPELKSLLYELTRKDVWLRESLIQRILQQVGE